MRPNLLQTGRLVASFPSGAWDGWRCSASPPSRDARRRPAPSASRLCALEAGDRATGALSVRSGRRTADTEYGNVPEHPTRSCHVGDEHTSHFPGLLCDTESRRG